MERWQAQESRSLENWMDNGAVASIVGGSLTEGEMYNFYITSDVMAIYHDPGGWRHGGLQDQGEDAKEEFF